uniref:hypothetical protein n=1 Tax=Rhodococcus qingshengii TaxID=334542 RepID=UPI001C4E12C8|nr:hypothetical protein [Rhodococcus qingshengii]
MPKHYPAEQRAVKMVLDHLHRIPVAVCGLPVDRPEARYRCRVAASVDWASDD